MSGEKEKSGPIEYGFETRAVHAGAQPDPVTGARATPIYQTTSYVFDDTEHAADLFNLSRFGFIYSRLGNPTVSVLEERVASLEDGRAGLAAASGHAAQFLTFFTLLEPGDEFIASRNLYGGSVTQFGLSFKRLGWTCHFVDPARPENFREALTPKTKAIFLEVLANPGGIVVDMEPVVEIAGAAGIPVIVDNTMASPYLCRPFESRCRPRGPLDHEVSSAATATPWVAWSSSPAASTGWQNDKFPSMTKPDPAYHGLTFAETFGDFGFTMKMPAPWRFGTIGPSMAPLQAFLEPVGTGMETLPLRMERHVARTRSRSPEYLEGTPGKVDPGSPTPGWQIEPAFTTLRQKYLPQCGAGAVVHLRRQGRLRGRPQGGRGTVKHVLAPRQYRRHAEPDHSPRLDDTPAA